MQWKGSGTTENVQDVDRKEVLHIIQVVYDPSSSMCVTEWKNKPIFLWSRWFFGHKAKKSTWSEEN